MHTLWAQSHIIIIFFVFYIIFTYSYSTDFQTLSKTVQTVKVLEILEIIRFTNQSWVKGNY